MVIPCNIGPFWCGRGSFVPRRGTIERHGAFSVEATDAYAALFVVPLVDESLDAVVRVMGARTFLTQRGLFRGEPAVRAIVFRADEQPDVFRTEVVAIAERLAAAASCGEIVVEFQRSGLGEKVIGVVP